MDNKSIEILEFDEIKKIIAGYTSFSIAGDLALNLQPLSDYEQVSLLLRQSAEARHLLSVDTGFTTSGAADIREAVSMAALGNILEPARLIEIQQTLAVMRQARSNLHRMITEVPLLWDIARDIIELPDIEREITRCISPSGEVLDRASPQLATARRQLRESRQELRERLERIMNTPKNRKIIQEPIITEREGRYVIPIKVESRSQIRGITHDVSNTGATVFVEPLPTVELGNTVRELVTTEKREVEKVLQRLSATVGEHQADILPNIMRLAELDLILAKARYARTVRAVEPGIIDLSDTSHEDDNHAYVKLVDARHPLLGQKAIPLSVEIGVEFSILVITGPNTGGKTVALKTIGLLSLMTQAGIPIPVSSETRLPVFDVVFADIGDEQSIEQTLSSFSWHIGNINRIINYATERSLVLLDELGTSTDPAEGSALARSILLHFLSSRILTVATTHFGDLKAFAHTTPGLQNASFDFDPLTLTPTYHMTVGIPGGSNALAVATRLGVPPAIIDEAKTMLSQGALDLENTLTDIMTERQKMHEARETLENERDKIKAQNAELEGRLAQLRTEEKRIIDETRDNVVREAAELHKQIRQASSELRRKRTRESVDAARKSLDNVQIQLDSKAWIPVTPETDTEHPISVGDTVYLKEFNLKATVLAVSEEKQEIEVQSGQITLKVGFGSIEKVSPGDAVQPGTYHSVTSPATRPVPAELDLRGRRADEVEVALDGYLNDAALTNLNELLIIHGYGTGTVRQIVRDYLSVHPLVRSFRPGRQGEGGDGVTVVSL